MRENAGQTHTPFARQMVEGRRIEKLISPSSFIQNLCKGGEGCKKKLHGTIGYEQSVAAKQCKMILMRLPQRVRALANR